MHGVAAILLWREAHRRDLAEWRTALVPSAVLSSVEVRDCETVSWSLTSLTALMILTTLMMMIIIVMLLSYNYCMIIISVLGEFRAYLGYWGSYQGIKTDFL